MLISWIWQAGGVASRGKPIVDSEDAKGLKIRGGSREMDMILKDAGAAVVIPAVQRNLCRDANRRHGRRHDLVDLVYFLPSGGSGQSPDHRAHRRAYWFMFEPLMMSKADLRRAAEGPAGRDHGGRRRARSLRAREAAKADDEQGREGLRARPAPRCTTSTTATLGKWRDIARETAWKDLRRASNANCAELLKLAEQVS